MEKKHSLGLFKAAVNAFLLHGGSLFGRLFRRRLFRQAKNGKSFSEKKLLRLLKKSRNTEYGKKYGFREIKNVDDYREKVPLSTYDDYRELIRRTAEKGEQKLMTGRKIVYFATTSGTVTEVKLIPQILASYLAYFEFICIILNDLTVSLRSRGVKRTTARGLLLTEISAKPASEFVGGEEEIPAGGISSFAASGVGIFLPLFTPLPKEVLGNSGIRDMKYIKARYALQDPTLKWYGGPFMSAVTDLVEYMEEHHEMLIRDIGTGTIDPSVEMTEDMRMKLEKKLRPDPARAAELREIFEHPTEAPLLSRIWNNLSYVAAIGTGDFTPFTRRMMGYCDKSVRFGYAMYAASEALMGIAVRLDDPRYLLLHDTGFYEFLPVDENGEPLSDKTLLAHELEMGRHYEIIVTNISGLYRYRIRDVVKVLGYEGETPYIEFAFRETYLTDICSIHLMSEFLLAAVEMTEKETGVDIYDYSLYPDADHKPPRLELFIEAGVPLSDDALENMSRVFDEALHKTSRGYNHWRSEEVMGPAVLRQVPAGTHLSRRDYKISHGASSNQLKTARVIKDEKTYSHFAEKADAMRGAENR